MTPEEIEEHPIYTQFLVPQGLGWFAAVTISPDPLINVWISIQRAKAKPPYTDAELDTLGRLARHAEQSLRLSIRLFDAEFSKLVPRFSQFAGRPPSLASKFLIRLRD